MPLRALALSACLSALGGAGLAAPNIADANVGRILVSDYTGCAYVAIAPDLLVVPAACVQEPKASRPVDPTRISIVGKPGIGVNDIANTPSFRHSEPMSDSEAALDVAFLRLDGPIAGPFERLVLANPETGVLGLLPVGAEGTQMPTACHAQVRTDQLIELDCPLPYADYAGSPVFDLRDDRRVVVGIIATEGVAFSGAPVMLAPQPHAFMTTAFWHGDLIRTGQKPDEAATPPSE